MFYSPKRSSVAARLGKHSTVRGWMRYLFVLLLMATLIPAAMSHKSQAVGDCFLDPTFGRDGKVTTNFSVTQDGIGTKDAATAVAFQSDGKIVVAGNANVDAFAVARYEPAGQLDQGFGDGGKVTYDFTPQFIESAAAVAIQTDGKIVVAGTLIQTGYDFGLLRYNTDGTLDDGTASDSTPNDSFGDHGTVITNFQDASYEHLAAMLLQPDGKIVVAGDVNLDLGSSSSSYKFALARYNSDGSLDQNFGDGGKVVTQMIDPPCHSSVSAIALQNDGKIVAAGETLCFDGNRFALARYNGDGSLDDGLAGDSTPSDAFGNQGRVLTDVNHHNYAAPDMLLQPNGKIVVAGTIQNPAGSYDFGLQRYNGNGQLDQSFGSGGLVLTDFFGDDDIAHAIAIQPNGKLVVAGRSDKAVTGYQPEDFALARYNVNGSLDPTFGDGGKVVTDIHYRHYDEAFDVAIDADGKIVAVGTSQFGRERYDDFVLVRYLADGTTPEPQLSSLTLSDQRASGCESLTGKVTLCSPAPAGGLTVQLSDNIAAVSVPASVFVPEGETSATFNVTALPVNGIQSGSIVARLGTITRNATLVVQPVGVSSLALSPNPVTGPHQATGTVTLSCPAPAGGITVQVSSNKPAIASPAVSSVTIPAGARSKAFKINTADVPAARMAIIKATTNGISKSAVLTVR